MQQQKANLDEVAVFGQLIDRITAIEQNAFVTVDVGDPALAARGRREPRVVGEEVGFRIELADVDHVGSDRAARHRKVDALVAVDEGRLAGGFG